MEENLSQFKESDKLLKNELGSIHWSILPVSNSQINQA